jgi:hypothetical protein
MDQSNVWLKGHLRVFQLIVGLYLSNYKKPRTIGFEGNLIKLNTMMLRCPFKIIFNP